MVSVRGAFRVLSVSMNDSWNVAVSGVSLWHACMCRLSIPFSGTYIRLTSMRASFNLFLGRLGGRDSSVLGEETLHVVTGVSGMGGQVPGALWGRVGVWIGPCWCSLLPHLLGFGADFLGVFWVAGECFWAGRSGM